MTVSLKHQFHSLKGDGTDPTKVQPSNWNEEHELTMATAKVLGRITASAGPVEELDASPLGLAILAAIDKAALAALGVSTTGDLKLTLKSTEAGWVPMNDGTIGNSSSLATTRANADVQELYVLIWGQVDNTYAPVTGGRGGTAIGDFNAGKPMALPKALGRALVAAGTGSGLSSRTLGSTFGEESHVLTTPEIPAHSHSNTLNDPGHTHTVNIKLSNYPAQPGGDNSAGNGFGNVTSGSSVTGITITNASAGGGPPHPARRLRSTICYSLLGSRPNDARS